MVTVTVVVWVTMVMVVVAAHKTRTNDTLFLNEGNEILGEGKKCKYMRIWLCAPCWLQFLSFCCLLFYYFLFLPFLFVFFYMGFE